MHNLTRKSFVLHNVDVAMKNCTWKMKKEEKRKCQGVDTKCHQLLIECGTPYHVLDYLYSKEKPAVPVNTVASPASGRGLAFVQTRTPY